MNKKNSLRVFSVTAWGAFVLSCLFVFPLLSACDVAYSASVTGTVVDKELYDQDPKTGAINNVFVYVYWNEKDRESDYRFWVKHNWKPEEKPATDEKGKKLKRLYNDMAVTNADGVFTFSALWWLDFFPEFGTDASVENAYFMFYHKDYGMVKYEKATLLTGDGRTRTLAPFPIVKQIHEAILKGRVIDKNRTLNGSPVGLPGEIGRAHV